MTLFEKRRLALHLRKQGKSYSQIKKELGLSKSTLSDWLRQYPLTKEQIDILRGKNPIRIERFRRTMQRKRQDRLNTYYEEEKLKWLPLTEKELFLSGLFLYWGEGNKASRNTLVICNTDPALIKFSLFWITYCLKVPMEKLRISFHLYSDMKIEEEILYWSTTLGVQRTIFSKPYIKKSKKIDIDRKGFGHGTCSISVGDTVWKERVMMAIKMLGDHYPDIFRKSLI